ncbi:hypothetical protein B0H63DRAFT_75116 [Podospora didyma]|uniref:N-acetyltransferase domain-containing protein n=1 Tax=Podospora didyma TaxID=330526 RepID=A0AAE0K2A2_9PEZI|nr:hypothetical protein B0H63DRAFT_75116 [Podospora didyma]
MTSTEASEPPLAQWSVELVPQDDEGMAFYLAHCRPFRLKMLQDEPSAYGSTFARESAFDDKVWRTRAINRRVRTFVAIRRHVDDEKQTTTTTTVLSSLSLWGPTFIEAEDRDDLISAAQAKRHAMETRENSQEEQRPLLKWDVAGMYTDKDSRREGIGATVLEAASQYAIRESEALGADCVVSLEITAANSGARTFYEKSGFKFLGVGDEGNLRFTRLMHGTDGIDE